MYSYLAHCGLNFIINLRRILLVLIYRHYDLTYMHRVRFKPTISVFEGKVHALDPGIIMIGHFSVVTDQLLILSQLICSYLITMAVLSLAVD
jgi:hypothetical protein